MSRTGSDQIRAAWISGLLGIVAVLIGAVIGLRPAFVERMLSNEMPTDAPLATPASLPGSAPTSGVATRPATPIDQDYPVPPRPDVARWGLLPVTAADEHPYADARPVRAIEAGGHFVRRTVWFRIGILPEAIGSDGDASADQPRASVPRAGIER